MHRAQHTVIAPILFLMLACSLAGCYTLLKHPNVSEGPEETDFGRCTDCHSSYSHATPHNLGYAEPWWDYYELPWWYQSAIVLPDSLAGKTDYRSIIEREPVRSDGSGVGINPPGAVGVPLVPTKEHRAEGESAGEDKTTKKRTGDDLNGDKRSIEDRNATRRRSDDKAADTKSRQSADDKDRSKGSDETKDVNEKKKEKP